MPLNFPSSPALNDTYTYAGVGYVFNGTGWIPKTDAPPLQASAFKNLLINGDFQVWQRAYSSTNTADGYHTADRWSVYCNSGSGRACAYSRQAFTPGQTDVPGEPRYFFRWQETNGGSGYTSKAMAYGIEGIHHLHKGPLTLSFWAKASSPITLPTISIDEWLDNPGDGSQETVFSTNLGITTSWQKYTFTFTLQSLAGLTIGGGGWLTAAYLGIHLPVSGAFTFDISNVQLEYGTEATDFEERPYSVELALCQRYYEHSFDELPDSVNGWKVRDWTSTDGVAVSSGPTAGDSRFFARFKQMKPYTPSYVVYSSTGTGLRCSWEAPGNTNSGSTDIVINNAQASQIGILVGAGVAQGVIQGAYVYANWEADAEL